MVIEMEKKGDRRDSTGSQRVLAVNWTGKVKERS